MVSIPARYVHEMIEKELFGDTLEELHKAMDKAWEEKGIRHRSYGHSLKDVVIIAMLLGIDPIKAIKHGLLHIALDEVNTKLKYKLMNELGLDGNTADLILYYLWRRVFGIEDKRVTKTSIEKRAEAIEALLTVPLTKNEEEEDKDKNKSKKKRSRKGNAGSENDSVERGLHADQLVPPSSDRQDNQQHA